MGLTVPPPPLSYEEWKRCMKEGKNPLEVDGFNAWRRENDHYRVAMAAAIGFALVCFLIIIIRWAL